MANAILRLWKKSAQLEEFLTLKLKSKIERQKTECVISMTSGKGIESMVFICVSSASQR